MLQLTGGFEKHGTASKYRYDGPKNELAGRSRPSERFIITVGGQST